MHGAARRHRGRQQPTIGREGHAPHVTRGCRSNIRTYYSSLGSRSTPLFDTAGSVQRLRLKQHGLRAPALSFEQATSIRRFRVSGCLVARIHRIQSQRAIGVISIHSLCTCGLSIRALCKSAGASGSGHAFIGSIASVTVSPGAAPAASSMAVSTLSQWLLLPSGSSAA